MVVAFDEQIFIFQRAGGVARYFTELILALRECAPVEQTRLQAHFGRSISAVESNLVRALPTMMDDPRFLYILNQSARRKRRGDVLHFTYYHPRFLKQGWARRTVSTVHDMIPELMPNEFRTNPHLAKSQYLDSSDLLLCVSETTKRDLVSFYPHVAERSFVTPLGVSRSWFEASATSVPGLTAGEPFLLYVGPRGGYKDFDVFVSALAMIRRREQPRLVLVGGPPLTSIERESLRRAGLENRCLVLGRTSDSVLRALYGSAAALVFTSRYEGFGLPVLEAMAAGCVVIHSSAPALEEVAGGRGVSFPVGQPEMLRGRIQEVLESPTAWRKSAVHQAREHARGYTWSRTASATVAAYENLAI